MNIQNIIFLVTLFLAVSGFTYGVVWLLLRSRISNSRLQGGDATAAGSTAAGGQWLSRMVDVAAPLAKLARPDEGWESSRLRIRFMNAGLRHAAAPIFYFAAKAGLALAFPVLFMVSHGVGVGGMQLNGNAMLFVLLLTAATGYYLPNLWLSLRVKSHQLELFEAFPDAIDMIIVCIEAGLGLDAAIARTGEEMRMRSPSLADELHLVGLELRVGASRMQALHNLSLRTGLDEVAALVAMLQQADRFGSSIAESLRVHADALRTRRRQKAEEAAAKIPLKLLFPLIFCIFPSLMLVLIGPAAISIYRVFLKTIVGQ